MSTLRPPFTLPTIVPSTAPSLLERLLDVAPDLELLRLLAREDDVAGLGVGGLEVDVDVVALLDVDAAVAVA